MDCASLRSSIKVTQIFSQSDRLKTRPWFAFSTASRPILTTGWGSLFLLKMHVVFSITGVYKSGFSRTELTVCCGWFQFECEISNLYLRTDFVGRICQQILQPPSLRQSPKKSPVVSPAIRRKLDQHQSPRLSLRWLASYQNIGYIMALYLFMYMWWGTGPVGFVFMLLCLGVLFAVFKAFLKPVAKPKTSWEFEEDNKVLDYKNW